MAKGKEKVVASKKKVVSEKTEAHPLSNVRWHRPDNIITRFATNMTIEILGNDFRVSFFELKPEIYLATPKKPITEVQADCVASVIVTNDRMPLFIELMQKQLNLYEKLKSKE